MDQYSGK